MISGKASKKLKNNFPENKQKHNVSLTMFHDIDTKRLEGLLVNNKPEFF